MRSFIGLYKMLQIATPAIAHKLPPLEDIIKRKTSLGNYIWNQEASMKLREAKSYIKNIHTLYLHHSEDQLLLIPYGSWSVPGVGHILYVGKESKLVPVRFLS